MSKTEPPYIMEPTYVATEIDERDVNTPDHWVPRDPRLIRLTGKHPFNVEPPLDLCYDQGFITPPAIHYVRNHGYAPDIKWEDHRLTFGGLLSKPGTYTMDQLTNDFKHLETTLPVTLVCAGNRRKEQNMTKKTIGFNWGPCAVATSYWRGIRLADMLEHLGIDKEKTRHVTMLGHEDLPNGKYGTSIPVSLAMDRTSDVLISWEHNGIPLTTDHGYPLRIIIPGWIGGRMIKWVTLIEATEAPSDNYYHFFDNRIMPPHVDADLAKAEGWWYKPEYLFNQLNINSAVAHPWHDTFVPVDDDSYLIRGYAYSGGGAKVTRVEISFDNCNTWKLCDCNWPEEELSYAPKMHDKYWCWMFWEYKVDMVQMLQCPEFQIRAWDATNNTQPEKLTWNLMGMGNNPVFRVKCHIERQDGKLGIRFEHPTKAGAPKGGWMNRDTGEPDAPVAAAPASDANLKEYSWDEVSKHTSEESVWFVVDGKVYDGTSYLKDHPGGAESIIMNGGLDATEDFVTIHSTKAKAMLNDYLIGKVTGDRTAHANESDSLTALNPTKWIPFKLVQKDYITRDTVRLKFALQSPEHKFGLPVGWHAFMRCKTGGDMVIRAYTPVSSDDDLGFFELVIKIYFAKENPKFPDGGKMSQWFHTLKVGEEMEVKGPMGHFEYKGKGNCILNGKAIHVKKIGLMAGGTGITPCMQVLMAISKDPEDPTEAHLLFANKSPEDVLLMDALLALAAKRSNIHVWFTVDSAPPDWKYSTGFINAEMIKDHLGGPSEGHIVGMCGPPPMYKFACIPGLEQLGFKTDDYFLF